MTETIYDCKSEAKKINDASTNDCPIRHTHEIFFLQGAVSISFVASVNLIIWSVFETIDPTPEMPNLPEKKFLTRQTNRKIIDVLCFRQLGRSPSADR